MNKTKKILTGVLCGALTVAVSVMGTLAYLTDRDSVANTFTVGNVDIKLDEKNIDGKPNPEEERDTANTYHLIPGQTYIKDPTMTVLKGSEESYVRMKVTINKAKELKEIFGADFLPQNYVAGWDSTTWKTTGVIEEDTANNTLTYEFRYKETVKPEAEDLVLDALFDSFTLPGEITKEQLATISDLTITVNGHAIQAATFADADAAWAAFDAQHAETK